MLNIGSVSVPNSTNNNAEFRIRDISNIKNVILPIFDKYTLLTSKQFNYNKFRKAIMIYSDPNLSLFEKNVMLNNLKNITLPKEYFSPVWANYTEKSLTFEIVNSIMSKEWLVGFTEAEGSFYLVNKGINRMTHAFEITQKLDKIVLIAISLILPMKVYNKKTYFSCVTTNQKSVSKIIDYFKNTMKGMKSLEYRIWARSFSKNLNYNELVDIREKMRRIRSIRNKL